MRNSLLVPIVFAIVATANRAAAQTDRLQWTGDALRWSGTVAQGKTLQVKGVNGSIRTISSEDGWIYVDARRNNSVDVPVEVIQQDGNVTICAGECTASRSGVRSWSDDVRVDFAVRVPPGVRFVGANVSGNIRVEGLRGEVRVATVSGNVNIQLTEFAARATTVSGSVVLELPAGANATFHANSVSGRIDADFPGLSDVGSSIPTGDSSFAVGRRRLPIVEGTIGSGGPELRVTTVSGNIRLRQR